MKIVFKILFALGIIAILPGCEKKDNLVKFEGGTAPVLAKSTDASLALNKANKNDNIITLNWTNPNYSYNTGVNSQTVTYLIQIDKAGSNFTSSALQEVSFSGELQKTFTVNELNTLLNKMELEPGVTQNLEIRVKSALGSASAAPLLSNVISLKVIPYLDFAVEPPGTEAGGYLDASLWVTGDAFASGYANPLPSPYDVTQKFKRIDLLHYEAVVQMVGGGAYKMIQKQNDWSTQYHALSGSTWDGGSFEKKDADPGFSGAPTAGTYKITVNFQTGKYTVVKQ